MKSKIFYFVLGAIIFGSIGAYAATTIASANVTYTNNNQENVQGAIDDLFDKAKDYAKVEKCEGDNCKKCKRATMLHTEICTAKDSDNPTWYCSGAGYNQGDTIIYGQIGSGTILRPGDAFDCDLNGDGYYDPLIERFYYVRNTIIQQQRNLKIIQQY